MLQETISIDKKKIYKKGHFYSFFKNSHFCVFLNHHNNSVLGEKKRNNPFFISKWRRTEKKGTKFFFDFFEKALKLIEKH